jgi:hypothetical protein
MNQYAGRWLSWTGSYELLGEAEICGQVGCGRFLRQECIRPSFQKKWVPLPDHVGAYLASQALLTLEDQHSQW